jgi:hypothetical protein
MSAWELGRVGLGAGEQWGVGAGELGSLGERANSQPSRRKSITYCHPGRSASSIVIPGETFYLCHSG